MQSWKSQGAVVDDALQRRIGGLVAEIKLPRSVNRWPPACLGTTIGTVRERNQDRALVAVATYPAAPERNFILTVVCDGIGGLARGDEAAVLAISVFTSRVLRTPKQLPSERLHSAAMAANDAVYSAFRGRGGSTLASVLVPAQEQAAGVNVGDTRIYGLTQSGEAKQLSIDDTLGELLGSPNAATPNRHKLVQYVGMGEGLEPHILHPAKREFEDILITSDGAHNVPKDAFSQMMRVPSTNLDLVSRLLTLSEVLGGQDNATAALTPLKFDHKPRDAGGHGLIIELFSVSDRLEIWIPLLSEEYRKIDMPTALTDASDAVERPNTSKKAGHVTRRGKPHHKPSSKKKSQSIEENIEQPALDITFPKKEE
jgi:serine/threonine protein phosphatase PrpC